MAITNVRQGLIIRSFTVLAVLLGILFCARDEARAHCDTMDGPVVKAAQKSLATKNVNLVLIWVQKKDETEIRQRFLQTLDVRRLSHQARELADNYFFETVVRLHRAGEGEPYMGLKPAGTDLGQVIPVADKAFQDGSLDALLKLFAVPARAEIQARFREAITKKSFNENDIEAGREYVKAYITFMHHIEHLYEQEHRTEGGMEEI
jgi:Family of unknown function (DUF6448)